jgi:hypothetical protein
LGEIELPMTARKTRAHKFSLAAAVLLAACLAACTAPTGNPDDNAARFFIAPDQFVLFNCEQLATRAVVLNAREKELREAIAKAGPGADAQLVSALSYRSDYISVRGDLSEVRKAAVVKKCPPLPAPDNASGRASDDAVR